MSAVSSSTRIRSRRSSRKLRTTWVSIRAAALPKSSTLRTSTTRVRTEAGRPTAARARVSASAKPMSPPISMMRHSGPCTSRACRASTLRGTLEGASDRSYRARMVERPRGGTSP
ncbi:hypothetical protein ACFFX0_28545 [Citricoccus parietis]|uniref:Uncharacterized protein n=1 Tax=Citricoccus parietis TaxID=592307 RepID=A0ABV5G7I3_9MICC